VKSRNGDPTSVVIKLRVMTSHAPGVRPTLSSPPLCLSASPPLCLSASPPLRLSASQPLCLSASLPLSLSASPPLRPSALAPSYDAPMIPILHTAAQLIIALVGTAVCGLAAGKLSNRPWLGRLVAAAVLTWHSGESSSPLPFEINGRSRCPPLEQLRVRSTKKSSNAALCRRIDNRKPLVRHDLRKCRRLRLSICLSNLTDRQAS